MSERIRWSRWTEAATLLLLFAAGCSREPKLVPVNGLVKINGKATGGVRVHFYPLDTSAKTFVHRLGVGITDSEGKFVLHSSTGDGVEAGEYKVTFSRPLAGGGKTIDSGKKPEETGAKESLPPKYTDQDKTEERASVTEASHDFTFDLKTR